MIRTCDFKDNRLLAIRDEPVTIYPIDESDLIETRLCLACGGDSDQEILAQVFVGDLEVFTTTICRWCGFIWRSVAPKESWFQKCADRLAVKPAPTELESLRSVAYTQRAEFIGRHVKSRTMVDIGAAYGAGLMVFRRLGYDVSAIEPDEIRAEFLEHQVQAPVYRGTIETAIYNGLDKRYGLVLLCHVLEHCRNPHLVLQELDRLLLDEGVAYVEVPSAAIINWSDAFYLAHFSNFTFSSFNVMSQRVSRLNMIDGQFFTHESNRPDMGYVLARYGEPLLMRSLSRKRTEYIRLLYRRGLQALVPKASPLKYRVPHLDHFNYGLRFHNYSFKRDGEFIELRPN